MLLSSPLIPNLHLHQTTQEINGFIFYPVILIAKRFPFVDVKDLAYIAIRMGPDQLISPRFLYLFRPMY